MQHFYRVRVNDCTALGPMCRGSRTLTVALIIYLVDCKNILRQSKVNSLLAVQQTYSL